MISKIKEKAIALVEWKLFGVCTWLGQQLGISSTRIRMYFIYLSFFTFGSPIILYLMASFVLENKHYFKPKAYRKPTRLWEL